MTRPLFAVVLAGGRGTRFWPRSRRALPKQFLRLTGPRSLLQETVARVRSLAPPSRLLVVTTRDLRRAVRRDLPRLSPANLIVEPAGRNTAPAIALAAHAALAREEDPVLLVLPSDHFVGDAAAFRAAVQSGIRLLEREPEGLVVFGVRPTRPETGYGYIREKAQAGVDRAEGDAGRREARPVAQFIEKPDLERAKSLIKEEGVYWNAGVFLWRARTFLDALATHAPEVSLSFEKAAAPGRSRSRAGRISERAYARVPAVSVDVAVLEKAANVFVVPLNIPWSDLGSWISLAEVSPKDEAGNVVEAGGHEPIDTRDCIIFAPNKLVATIGLEGVIAVDTKDALLICRADRAQDVRELVRRLEARRLHRLT